MSTDEERSAAFAYQVKVCEQILQEFPDAYIGRGFAARDFSEARRLDQERRYEAFERLRRDYPDVECNMFVFEASRPECGSSKVAGWHDILDAQRRELERRCP